MNSVWRFRGGGALAALLLLSCWTARSGAAHQPTDAGGVLVLQVEGDQRYEYGSLEHCADLRAVSPDSARLRMSADGVPRLVGLYAVFPEDSVGCIKAVSFGLRYTSNVRVVGYGTCSGGGMEIAMNGWPANLGGMSFTIMPESVQTARIIPLCWFGLQCSGGPGSFEIIPHPVPRLAGRFVAPASGNLPYIQEPISGYGKVGFDQAGLLPKPGTRAQLGAACVTNECWALTEAESRLYGGVYLGDGTSCDSLSCGRLAQEGACCLPGGGCEMYLAIECAKLGGRPMGDKKPCDPSPCVPPAPADRVTTPANEEKKPE